MDISKVSEGYLGYTVTIVTIGGNKIQGSIIKNFEDSDSLKVKTEDGIIMVNSDAIESIY
jgi:hypothetical protein